MIHTCNNRKWYVDQYLMPSLLLQGIDIDHIIIWLDKQNKGCLISCMQAFQSLPYDGYVWHLQDDIVICHDFKEKTEKYANYAPIVCGYCYWRNAACPDGLNHPMYMWYSFPCIKINNKLAKECSQWFFKKAINDPKYNTYISTGKFDDTIFREYCRQHYMENYIVYNLKPNLVDHIDYLIGGSIVNNDRKDKITYAAYFEQPERVEQLKNKLVKKDLRVAAYCGTKNLYKNMIPAIKSLLINSNVDKIYLLIEDDKFPYKLPPQVETINVKNQGFFKQDGPNMNSRFTYMAMMRAALPFIFPQYDKILSLDIDTIAIQDISELWDIDLKNNYFAACVQPERCKYGKFDNRICEKYYNAGVVMYNLQQLRDGKGMAVIKQLNKQKHNFLDQDVMNFLCDGKTITISNDYNYCKYSEYQWCGKSFDPKIIHYAGIKDWDNFPEIDKYRKMEISDGHFKF